MPTMAVESPRHLRRAVYFSACAFQSGSILQLSRAMVFFFASLSPFEMCHSIMSCHAGDPPFGIDWIYSVRRGIFTKLLLENQTSQLPRFPRVICHDTHPDNTTQNKPPVSPHASIHPPDHPSVSFTSVFAANRGMVPW